jgi:SAM-dependent methyltransferase
MVRMLRRIILSCCLFTAVWAALHYPLDSDATLTLQQESEAQKSARRFYEAAYRPASAAARGLDYEETAAQAAKTYNIEGSIRDFVRLHGLEQKRVLEIGSGRGYLQDVVADYTGLDLSSKVAPYYHKPFVVGSATDMPFPESSYDVAWTIWVLEHIPEPEKAFEEMRRVIKPGGLLYLAPAWNSPAWLADGFDVRPYSDFNMAGKLVKASIPLRRSLFITFAHMIPVRAVRLAQYRLGGEGTRLRYRRLDPNYEVYWQADSDAAVSLDRFESRLWFESRGDACLNCGSTATDLFVTAEPLVVRVLKP